jgi:type 1 glutamine amidotransferase
VRRFWKIVRWALLAILLVVVGLALWIGPMAYSALYPSHDHDKAAPVLPARFDRPAILVFSKTNGFRHGDAIAAAGPMFVKLGQQNGWDVFQTENGAVHTPDLLARFKVVVWSNASGDVLSDEQRGALKAFIEDGGGFVAIHAAGDSSHEFWPWYVEQLIGTKFVGHSMWPHFAQATIHVEARDHPAMAGLPAEWSRLDEWYSFDSSVRGKGFDVLATLDESTYERGGPGSAKLSMGKDHPIIWSRCLGKGRVFYSALGHTAESFSEAPHMQLIANAIGWTGGLDGSTCASGNGAAEPTTP